MLLEWNGCRLVRGQGDPKGTRGQGGPESTPAVATGAGAEDDCRFHPRLPCPLVPLSLVPASAEDRRGAPPALTVLAEQVSGPCMRCKELASTRTQTVFGVGPIDPDLCFIGESPGADEDQRRAVRRQGGPVVKCITGRWGMSREDVYICNIIRCRPPGNRQPRRRRRPTAGSTWSGPWSWCGRWHLCCLGASAAAVKYLLGTTRASRICGDKFFDYNRHPRDLLRITPRICCRPASPKKERGVGGHEDTADENRPANSRSEGASAASTLKFRVAALARVRGTRVLANAATRKFSCDSALVCRQG